MDEDINKEMLNNETQKCRYCYQIFISLQELDTHMDEFHPVCTSKTEIKMNECHICNKEFDQLEVHFLNCHSEEFQTENEVKNNEQKIVEKTEQLNVPKDDLPPLKMEESMSQSDIEECDFCDAVFNDLTDMKKHMQRDELSLRQNKILQFLKTSHVFLFHTQSYLQ